MIKLNEAQTLRLANEALEEWACHGWSAIITNGKRELGVCRYKRKVIGISRHLIRLNPMTEVMDTIWHEVAHVKAGHEAGHGRQWMVWAELIGCRPEACADAGVVVVPHKYAVFCTVCNKITSKYHRQIRKNLAKYYCRRCGPDKSMGKLIFGRIIDLMDREAEQV